MYRRIEEKLVVWKDSVHRKPLILRGVRQVGKTWILQEFGRKYFKNTVVVNFDKEPEYKELFVNKSPARIISQLSLAAGMLIEPGSTLVIFDEIQECPDALNALKYFHEEMSDLHVVSAGGLLGVLLSHHSYPVGAVDLLEMHPMDFGEFLQAVEPMLYSAYCAMPVLAEVPEIFHRRLTDAYHAYLVVGGMPECVLAWSERHSPKEVLRKQNALIKFYEGDFGKHSELVNGAKCLAVFRSVVSQLAKDNEKFVFGVVRPGARAKDFEDAITWSVSAGLFNCVHNVGKIEFPLRAYCRENAFKVFLHDTGLLKAMAGIPNDAIVLNSGYQFKWPLAENYVIEQLIGKFDVEPFYFSDNSCREIDVLLQVGMDIVPIEVKAGENVKAISLKNYLDKRHPPFAIRFSENNFSCNGNLLNLPLYMAPRLPEILASTERAASECTTPERAL